MQEDADTIARRRVAEEAKARRAAARRGEARRESREREQKEEEETREAKAQSERKAAMYRAITARRTFEKAQLEAEEAGEDVLKHELWLKWGQPVLAVSATETEKQKAESDIAATKERLRKAVRAAEFAKGIANRKKVEWDEAENVAREKRALLREIFDARKAKAAEMMALEAAAAEVKHIQGPEGDLHAIALTLPTCRRRPR